MSARILLLVSLVIGASGIDATAAPPASAWVFTGGDGTLQYKTTTLGDKILDFSSVGYMSGTQNIPLVPVVKTLTPLGSGQDDTAQIQAAISQVAAMPLVNGFHGTIQLAAGTFNVGSSINLNTSGIVLRGAGQGTNGTLIHATGNADGLSSYDVIVAQPTGSTSYSAVGGTTQTISDSYVPVGATSFTVPNGNVYHVGDKIIVNRPSTQQWIDDIGMGTAGLGTEAWTPSSSFMQADRTITAINGNTLTINAGIPTAIDSRTINSVADAYGGGTIFKFTTSTINDIGIENLRFDTIAVPGSTDMNHAGRPISMNSVVNSWIRNTTTLGYYNGPNIGSKSENVTVQDSLFRDPAGDTHSGGFALAGQYSLVQRNTTYNAHAPFVTQASNSSVGPDVFLLGAAKESLQSVGPHQRWASGVLWDNIKVTNSASGSGGIELVNRGNFGSGQGWAGANMVTWNSSSPWSDVESPPTAQNWAIGAVTPNRRVNFTGPEGIYDSFNTRVTPNSLYLAQLQQKLGPQPSANVTKTFQIGDNDNFVNNGASDVPALDNNWKVIVQNDLPVITNTTIRGFDDATLNSKHAATINYTLGASDKVVSGTLTMKLKPLTNISPTITTSTTGTLSDEFFLDSAGTEIDYDMLGLMTTAVPWTSGTIKTVTINLNDIYGPLLGPLQNDSLTAGKFNLAWLGNVEIDYAQLSLGIVSPTVNKTWTGAINGTWDAGTTNWNDGVTVGNVAYSDFDNVTFDNTGANRAVTITGTVQPSSMTVNNDTNHAYSFGGGVIGGTTGITKQGTGLLTLTGANTFTGVMNIQGGTVVTTTLANGGAASGIGAAGNVAANLVLDGGAILKWTGAVATNSDRLFTLGAGGATIDASPTSSAALMLTNTGAVAFTGTGPRTLTLTGTELDISSFKGNTLFAGIGNATGVGQSTSVVKNGNNAWILRAGNTYAGGTTINAGRLQAFSSTSFGTGLVTVNAGGQAYVSGIGNNFSIAGIGMTETISGKSANLGAIRLQSNGTLSGQVTLAGDARITARGSSGTITGKITGGFGLELGGADIGTSSTGLMLTNTNNDWSGNTTISVGTVTLGDTQVIPHGAGKGNVTLNGPTTGTAILDLAGFDQTLNGLSSSGTAANAKVTNSGGVPATLTAGANDQTSSYAGLITDGVAATNLTKTGTGILALGGDNTYTGETHVDQGTLRVNGSHTGGGLYTVASGATLGGTGSITANINVAGTLSPGASIETLDVTGDLHFDNTSALEIELDGTSGQVDLLNVDGNLTVDPGSLIQFIVTDTPTASEYLFGTYTGLLSGEFDSVTVPSGYHLVQTGGELLLSVPEPSSLALAAAGLCGLLCLAIKRRPAPLAAKQGEN